MSDNPNINIDRVGGTKVTTAVPVSGTLITTPPSNATTNITQVGGANISEGQKAMAASVPVVVASDQTGIPVTGTFYQGTQPVSAASLPLPAGASVMRTAGRTRFLPCARTEIRRPWGNSTSADRSSNSVTRLEGC